MNISVQEFLRTLPVKLREEDKVKHIVWSFWLTLAALVMWPALSAFVGVLLLGLIKECWDSQYGSGFCLFDMAGNLLGSLAGLMVGIVAMSLPL
jgi:hypothetical protein